MVSKKDKECTFIYWFVNYHRLKGYQKWMREYSEWLDNEYVPELHGSISLVYWLKNLFEDPVNYPAGGYPTCHCDCLEIFENFPDIFENVSNLLLTGD